MLMIMIMIKYQGPRITANGQGRGRFTIQGGDRGFHVLYTSGHARTHRIACMTAAPANQHDNQRPCRKRGASKA